MATTIAFEELERQLNDPQLRSAFFERLVSRVVDVLLPASQARTPVRTGNLQRSEQRHVEAGGLRGSVWSDVVYGPFVHARQPFFQQAIDSSSAQIAAILSEEGGEYLEDLIR